MHLDGYTSEYKARDVRAPYAISAGGVVYRSTESGYEWLLLGKKQTDGSVTYHLPKGTLHIGDSLEATALREIKEETGVLVDLVTYLGARFSKQPAEKGMVLHDKTTHYYLARFRDNVDPMDNEHDFKEWNDTAIAIDNLSKNVKQEHIYIQRALTYLVATNREKVDN